MTRPTGPTTRGREHGRVRHPDPARRGLATAAEQALAAAHRHLDRCKLAANTVKAYKRQSAAYTAWLTGTATVKLLYAQSGLHIEVNPPGCPDRTSPTPSPPRSRAASSAPPPAAAPATGRSWRRCCTAAPASRNALACRWPTCS
ncbi:hypothetical protein ACIBEJ_33725 [Nonomuraea sp. NPDC050790]|uniref:hypothetical protein n=1 Tax=Nonomuraea sp. NPDC050790 TaxID=3364371 RepID=UPI00378B44C0